MRRTSLHVSQKHSHGCHCTAGDIIAFQACTALTELDLYFNNLTGKAKETSHPQAHPTHIESRSELAPPSVFLSRSIIPPLFCRAVLWCVYVCA